MKATARFAKRDEGNAFRSDIIADHIREAPMSAIVVGFGAGLVIGVMLAQALAEGLAPRPQTTAERLGQSVMEALAGLMPEGISRRLSS